ncbi:MAG: TetR/AcrR family transcriptional regulator [Longimicrobiales bacterium]|nr:TetR/AcrR family transcriptional regulator [Longimicrobiales bacterium]
MVQSAVSTPSPHVRRKRERRRGEILHAALATVREKGYHATTLDDIAERLGVRKTALYHYFADKEAILYACHRESLAELERILQAATTCCESERERLAFLIREHVRVMTEKLEGSPLAFEVSALAPERRAEVIAGRDRYERYLRQVVAEGVRRGEFRAVDAKLAVFALLGAINWIARWYSPEGGAGGEALGHEFADTLIRGLVAPDAPAADGTAGNGTGGGGGGGA